MALVGFLMFLFFGMHNILQEAIVNLLNVVGSESSFSSSTTTTTTTVDDGSSSHSSSATGGTTGTTTSHALDANWTLMLGYAEVIGVLAFSYIERVRLTNEGGMMRNAPLSAYPLLTDSDVYHYYLTTSYPFGVD